MKKINTSNYPLSLSVILLVLLLPNYAAQFGSAPHSIRLNAEEKNDLENLIFTITENMVYIPKATIEINPFDTPYQYDENNLPLSEADFLLVKIDDFFISKYEVTIKEWNIIMKEKKKIGPDLQPVSNLSTYEVWSFIDQLNQISGKKFRLPFINEWNYVADLTNDQLPSYSTDSCQLDNMIWYRQNSNSTLQQVALKDRSQLGLYDFFGNAAELVSPYYSALEGPNNTAIESDPLQVGWQHILVKGGSYQTPRQAFHCYNKIISHNYRDGTIGFRLVMQVQ